MNIEAIPVDRKAEALLPEEIRKSGSLQVASSLDWAPFSFEDERGEPSGIDIDMIRALGRKLGLRTTVADLGASTIITSVQNGRYDVAVSQLVTTAERRRAVHFVEYIRNTLGVVRLADSPRIPPTDLCGRTFVATQGTGPLAFGRKYSRERCVAKGRKAITFKVFDTSASTLLALRNGRGPFLADRAVAANLTSSSSRKLVMEKGEIPGSETRSGIAYAKDQPELGKAVDAALRSLVADGTYQRILTRWGVVDQALPKAAGR